MPEPAPEPATALRTRPSNNDDAIELVAGLSTEALERCLLRANRHTEVGNRLLAFYLNDMQVRGIHQQCGYRSAVHYAVERLDMHRRRAQMLVAVGSALLKLRTIDQAFATNKITWSKTRLLCRVATEDTEREWLAKAVELSCRELEWLVKSSAPGERPPSGHGGGLPKVRFHVHAELGALDHEIWEQAKKKLGQERSAVVNDAELMVELSRMLLSTRADGSIPGRKPVADSCYRVVVDPGDKTVHTQDGPVPLSDAEVEVVVSDAHQNITPATRKRILDRDEHRCRCCRSARNLQVHHLRFVMHGGPTRLDNLLVLCSYCHSRIHEGLLRVRGNPQGEVDFQDRKGRSLRGMLPYRLNPAAGTGADYTLRKPEREPCSPGASHRPSALGQSGSRLPSPSAAQPSAGQGRKGEQPPWLDPSRDSKMSLQEQAVEDAAFVRKNLHRLKWRGGRMVFV